MKYPCVDASADYIAPKMVLRTATTMNMALADEHEETLGVGTVEAVLVDDGEGWTYIARSDPHVEITRDGVGVYALFDVSDGMIFKVTVEPVKVRAADTVIFLYRNRRIASLTPR